MPGLYCPSSWTPLPLTDSWVRACANGPCLSLRARLTYHNPQPQPVDGEAWAGLGVAGTGGRARSDVTCAPCPRRRRVCVPVGGGRSGLGLRGGGGGTARLVPAAEQATLTGRLLPRAGPRVGGLHAPPLRAG